MMLFRTSRARLARAERVATLKRRRAAVGRIDTVMREWRRERDRSFDEDIREGLQGRSMTLLGGRPGDAG